MTSLLRKVRLRTSIHAHRKVRSVLDGEYGSVHKGRSMDFDDLREYVPGDDIKDLDWKASARHGRPLIKRYIATRQHAVLLVVDTGCTMAALSDAQSTKRDVAVMAAGVFAQLAHRHGDLTGLVAGPASPANLGVRNAERIVHVPFGTNDLHIERMLRVIHDEIDAEGEAPRLDALLEYVARNVRRRTILVIVTDDIDLTDRHRALLRRLDAEHEILFCTVGDVTMTDPSLLERSLRVVGSGGHVPAFFRNRSGLHDDLLALGRRRAAETRATLGRLGIVGTRLAGEADVVPVLYELLDRQRHRGTVDVIGNDAPPSTFVPADDNIFGPTTYGTTWLVLGIVAVVLGIMIVAWCFRRVPAERQTRRRPADVPALKARYLSTIDDLEREFGAHHLGERELHHQLSRTVREFAADLGQDGAVAMTAALLEEAGLASAAAVIAGNEQPQFKERHESDPTWSCDRAKAVIQSW